MSKPVTQTPTLRERIVAVLRENREVRNIGALADELEAALPAAELVASIVPEHCSGSALSFEGGCLHVRKDGSGYIVVDEDDFVLEDDRCEGERGPEGSVHWIARFPAGEMTALRDFLNGQGFSALSAQAQDVADMPQSPWPASDWAIGRIKELEAQAVPEGRQLVPKEPTQEMCEAAPSLPAINAIDDLPLKKSGWSMSAIVNRKRYLAMLAAAPATQEGRQDDLGKIEIRLQKLIEADPDKARMASSNEDMRMWFVAELISEASGRIPLLEIEGLVSRHLTASKGGEA